jgi:hypothetical protein
LQLAVFLGVTAAAVLAGRYCLSARWNRAGLILIGLCAAGFAVSPLHSLLRETDTFRAAHQTELGPAGIQLLPAPFVAASRSALAHGGTWALWTSPISLPNNNPDLPGLLEAARVLKSETPYTSADAKHMSQSLYQASSGYCGNVSDLGWMAYSMMPFPLNCVRPTFVLAYGRPAPSGTTVVSSGDNWEVART